MYWANTITRFSFYNSIAQSTDLQNFKTPTNYHYYKIANIKSYLT